MTRYKIGRQSEKMELNFLLQLLIGFRNLAFRHCQGFWYNVLCNFHNIYLKLNRLWFGCSTQNGFLIFPRKKSRVLAKGRTWCFATSLLPSTPVPVYKTSGGMQVFSFWNRYGAFVDKLAEGGVENNSSPHFLPPCAIYISPFRIWWIYSLRKAWE